MAVKTLGGLFPIFADRACVSACRCFQYSIRFMSSAELPQWPKSKHPSPYEIFGLPHKKPDQQVIRRLYIRLAKEYHPDSASGLSPQVKNDRFKSVMTAYNILKDEDKRRMYDMSNASYPMSSTYNSHRRTTHAPTGANTGFYQEDDFYARWPFDGMDQEARDRMNDEEFQKNLAENRYRLVVLLGIAAAIYGAAQVYRLFKDYEERRELVDRQSIQIQAHTLRAQSNYGKGTSQNDRIERFLQSRQNSGYYKASSTEQDSSEEVLLSSEVGNLTHLDIGHSSLSESAQDNH